MLPSRLPGCAAQIRSAKIVVKKNQRKPTKSIGSNRAAAKNRLHAGKLEADILNQATSQAKHSQAAVLDLSFLNESEVRPAGDAHRVETKISRHVACLKLSANQPIQTLFLCATYPSTMPGAEKWG